MIALTVSSLVGYSQGTDQFDIQEFIENNFSIQELNTDYAQVYETLLSNLSHPLDLNSASEDELAQLLVLTPKQIADLINHRQEFGDLLSLYELQSIKSFTISDIKKIKPFIEIVPGKIQKQEVKKTISQAPLHYLILRNSRRLNQQRGYQLPNGYAGDQNHFFMRYRIADARKFSFGVTLEKDPGEILLTKNGFDFQSAHLQLKNRKHIKNLILGDYQVQFGQGLVFGSGFSIGKGGETITTLKRGNVGLQPYSSSGESGFFRGSGISLTKSKLQLTLLASRQNQDGIINNDSTNSFTGSTISSIYRSGLHRTSRELQARDALTETNIGTNLQFHSSSSFNLGINYLWTVYDRQIVQNDALYKKYEFSGSKNHISGMYVNYTFQNATFFGEGAISTSGGKGGVLGLILALSKDIDVSLLMRNFEKNFHSLYGASFSENTRPINESGIYWGLKWLVDDRHQFTAYYDQFKFPWLKYQVDSPSSGSEYLMKYRFSLSKSGSVHIQYRTESKGKSQLVDDKFRETYVSHKQNVNIGISYQILNAVTIKNRVIWNQYSALTEKSSGISLIQDVTFKFQKIKLSTRFAIFQTDDFENRTYAYEKDMLYGYSVPFYSGRGTRQYLLLQYNLKRSINFWIRYAQFNYLDREEIGTGLETIEDNKRHDLRIQTVLKF